MPGAVSRLVQSLRAHCSVSRILLSRHIKAEIDERDVDKVSVGQKVIIQTDALDGKRLNGSVVRVLHNNGQEEHLHGRSIGQERSRHPGGRRRLGRQPALLTDRAQSHGAVFGAHLDEKIIRRTFETSVVSRLLLRRDFEHEVQFLRFLRRRRSPTCDCSPNCSCHALTVYFPGGRSGKVKLPPSSLTE